ncbi:hypothetical protein MNEG_4039 [Monoraphidium neglectum]|uniref:Uncharacterized protein n=1 Tax=Monoraphidium neglectum TaxID=145388 RepID=A0A0D2LAW0_9CHLO|nr:hypothetical protein MNEG_4039 [Monoraphidium neglectum]KIZ03924.1 hypothetical protein MNEG_4039 [Monoraphidium neglectum]|eukprot:XP_013902943.1 hypothetical protein MNEG_4039 [Monoraphidium neglectum]
MEEQSEQDEDDAGLDTEALRQKLSAAPKYGANARLLLLNAARALAAEEEARGIQPGKAPIKRRQAGGGGPALVAQPPQATGSQLLALVPAKARPWVPYHARACTTQQARQQVALNLAGSYLALLARVLGLQPAERAKQSLPPAAGAVRGQVMSFVRGVLDPLRGANLVDDDLGDLVASKATDKIMARHEGACDADFLVGEYPQITKLVGALVEHYKKQRRHQRQQQAATAAAEGRGPG